MGKLTGKEEGITCDKSSEFLKRRERMRLGRVARDVGRERESSDHSMLPLSNGGGDSGIDVEMGELGPPAWVETVRARGPRAPHSSQPCIMQRTPAHSRARLFFCFFWLALTLLFVLWLVCFFGFFLIHF